MCSKVNLFAQLNLEDPDQVRCDCTEICAECLLAEQIAMDPEGGGTQPQTYQDYDDLEGISLMDWEAMDRA